MVRSSRVLCQGAIALAVILPAAYYILKEIQIAGTMGFPLDDSWIHLVFARNITMGDFFSYNPHQHAAGSTSPLWTVILAAGYLVTHSAVLMPKIFGILLNIGIGFVVFQFALYEGMKEFSACMTAILVVTATRLVWASVSGMEVSLYVLLATSSLYCWLRYNKSESWKKYLGVILAAAAATARPELILLPFFFLLHQIFSYKKPRTKGAKNSAIIKTIPSLNFNELMKQGIVFLGCITPFFLLNLSLSGHLYPLTYTAKTAGVGIGTLIDKGATDAIITRIYSSLWVANTNAFKWVWAQDNFTFAITCIILFVVYIVSWARKGIRTTIESAIILFGIVLFLYAPIRYIITGLPNFGQFGRYAAFLTPALVLFGAFGIYSLSHSMELKDARIGIISFAVVQIVCLMFFIMRRDFLGRGISCLR